MMYEPFNYSLDWTMKLNVTIFLVLELFVISFKVYWTDGGIIEKQQ